MAVGSPSLIDDEAQDDRSSRPGAPIDPGRVWLSIKSGWKLLPIAVVVGAIAGVLASMLLVGRVFMSEAILIWEPSNSAQGMAATRDLSTHAGILKSRVVLEAVRKKLKMTAPVDVLGKQIEVWFDSQSNLVTIETSSSSAKGAFDLADSVIEAFLDHQRALGRTRTRETVETLKVELKAAATSRDETQAVYDAFRATHGIEDFDFDSQRALQVLEELRAQASEAKAEVGALDARAAQLGVLTRSQPRVRTQSATRSDPTAERVGSLKAELAVAKARLAPDHPRLALLASQLAAAERHAASGASVIADVTTAPDPTFEMTQSSLAAARTERAAAAQRGEALQEAIAKAEERVNAFTAVSGEARKLLADVAQTAARAQELTAQLARAQESEHSSPVAFRVLTPPVLPEYPQASKRKVVAFGLTLLSTLACVLFLVFRPARDGKIYTAREAAFWTRVPVVGTSAWPRRAQAFPALVDELNDRAMFAAGNTLVVASSPEHRPLAGALAAALGPQPRPIAFSSHAESDLDASRSTALVNRHASDSTFFAWPGDSDGPTLRRAARMSDRVLVVVTAGSESVLRAMSLQTRLGRDTEVAVVLVGVPDELLALPDRVGKVDAFWAPSGLR